MDPNTKTSADWRDAISTQRFPNACQRSRRGRTETLRSGRRTDEAADPRIARGTSGDDAQQSDAVMLWQGLTAKWADGGVAQEWSVELMP